MTADNPKAAASPGPVGRRRFLQQTLEVAGAVAALGPATSAPAADRTEPALLPTVNFGGRSVTRLVIGGNPIYGHSHFNRLYSQHMVDWHTPERVLALLQRAEQAGINAWQNSYAERTLLDLDRYQAAGGKMHWFCLGKPDWDQKPERIAEAARRKPIGIAPHGALAEKLHRQNRLAELCDLLKRIRDQGVLVGLSSHNPRLIDLAEEKGWDVDYYMCCLYYLTRPKEEYRKILGEQLPLGEIYLPSDPPNMFARIKNTKKPCLVYKVLAAGRRSDSPGEIRRAFETAFAEIKPTDAVIVGMFQRFSDQVGENAALVRELCSRTR